MDLVALGIGGLKHGHAFRVVIIFSEVKRCFSKLQCRLNNVQDWLASIMLLCVLVDTNFVSDIDIGPCFHQQVHDAVVATTCRLDECRVPWLHGKWAHKGSDEVRGDEEACFEP